MKYLKFFNEEIDLSKYVEVEPGKWLPKGTRYEDIHTSTYKLTTNDILDIVHSFSDTTIPMVAIEEEMRRYEDKKIK